MAKALTVKYFKKADGFFGMTQGVKNGTYV
jgi:hypothetical protein